MWDQVALMNAMVMVAERASEQYGYRICGVVARNDYSGIWLCVLPLEHEERDHLDRFSLEARRRVQ